MIELTKNEKYAIVNILSQIMKADGIIHPKEEEFMDKAYSDLGITINDLEEIANIDDIQAKQIIDDMPNDSKDQARSLFVGMAESDGYVHPREKKIIEQIFGQESIFISHRDIFINAQI